MGRPDGFPDASTPGAAFPRQHPDLRLVGEIPQVPLGWGASDDVHPDAAADALVPAPSVVACAGKLVDPGLDALELGAKSPLARPDAALELCTQVAAPSGA